jgi:dihydroxyacid dehydratase/phosphogluconate dehydratase
LVEEGDIICLDGNSEQLFVRVAAKEMERRKSQWTRPQIQLPRGPMRIAAQVVRPLSEGALWWPRD